MRKCYKYDKEEYLAKDCKFKQPIKNRRSQANDSEDEKKEGFVEGSEQIQYNEPLYIINPKIDILF